MQVILSNNSSCNNCKKKAADPFGMNRLKEPNGVAIESKVFRIIGAVNLLLLKGRI